MEQDYSALEDWMEGLIPLKVSLIDRLDETVP
jgi:hypothetical protein